VIVSSFRFPSILQTMSSPLNKEAVTTNVSPSIWKLPLVRRQISGSLEEPATVPDAVLELVVGVLKYLLARFIQS
jgi:hypothetical protein